MQWGQIKTLLIISFLILDIYLFIQFMEKKDQADIGVLEQHTASLEQQLKDDRITYEALPKEELEETYMFVEQSNFTEDELAEEKKDKKQTTSIVEENLIVSKVDEQITINEEATSDQITDMFNQLVYYSDEYSFWNWNKEKNVLIFFQNKFDRPIYYNQGGLVLIFLDDKNNVQFYLQSMLGEEESLAEKRKLMKPIQAIETLYKANELPIESHVDDVKIGFHTRVPFDSAEQVFAPIWKVKVNEDKNYFVNAIEGFIFSTDENEFLGEVIELSTNKIGVTRHNEKKMQAIYDFLQEIIIEEDTSEENDDAL